MNSRQLRRTSRVCGRARPNRINTSFSLLIRITGILSAITSLTLPWEKSNFSYKEAFDLFLRVTRNGVLVEFSL